MWYAVETVFIDGNFFGSECAFTEGNHHTGCCYAPEWEEPKNRCETRFQDRIEIHTEWFETEQLAKDFRDGKIAYKHTYLAHYEPSINSTLRKFYKREILPVAGDIKPWVGIYGDIPEKSGGGCKKL